MWWVWNAPATLSGVNRAFSGGSSASACSWAMVPAAITRARFEPSAQLDKPYAMPGVNIVAAETDDEARRLFTSMQQQFVNLRRGTPGQLQPPLDDMGGFWSPSERAGVEHALRLAIVGSRETVRRRVIEFIRMTDADELIVTAHVYDHAARLRSFDIVASIRDSLDDPPPDALGVGSTFTQSLSRAD